MGEGLSAVAPCFRVQRLTEALVLRILGTGVLIDS